MLRWGLTLITGLLCGGVALLVSYPTKVLTDFKFLTFYSLVEREKSGELPFGAACAFLFLLNLLFALLAWVTVYMEPLAKGSGIPEVKCFLNGLDIPRLMHCKTLVCKVVGIVFSVSAGLPLGKEGPMVHAGAIVAAGVSQGNFCGMQSSYKKFEDFRNDTEQRDFVACGMAAGVAAAFGAPIGGVLFSLEEGASFWSTKLTWRAFFCAMTTLFTLYNIRSAGSLFGHSENGAMFSFGKFFLQAEQSTFSVWELWLFLCVGCLGGLIGAYFNTLTTWVRAWRACVDSTSRQLAEVLILTSVMSLIALLVPILCGRCAPLPLPEAGWSDQEVMLVGQLVPLYCNQGEYNELASLYLADGDTVIKQLFHFKEAGDQKDSTFSILALLLFFAPYTLMACFTYGVSVPAGMFVPTLTAGAAFGRLLGHILHTVDKTRGTFADSGTYALMGAIAITGGVTRMTISLTVMVLEATGDMQYVLPLMLTVMSARWVGNLFTEGLYDMHIHSKRLHYLDEDESVSRLVQLHDLTVTDIMTKRPFYLLPIMKVGDIYDVLEKAKHNCYPIVASDENNQLLGTVLRKTICSLLRHKAFARGEQDSPDLRITPLVAWSTLECIYPHYPDLDQLSLSDQDRNCWLDLRPYLDASPYVINEHSSVQRAYRLFRTIGLRHLLVINTKNQLLGIVTRADLVSVHSMADSFSHQVRLPLLIILPSYPLIILYSFSNSRLSYSLTLFLFLSSSLPLVLSFSLPLSLSHHLLPPLLP
ncbi:chloride channel [Ochromonadaceae sp. CCMP2298]|nr:chloride channel [Ochromonadaceae sp. CCMP2298]